MVSVSRMNVPSAVIKNSAISHGIFRKVAPVDEVAVQRVTNVRWVCGDGGVVLSGVQAVGAKGVPMQVGNSTPLPHVLIAVVDLALLWRVPGIVVESGINSLTLNGIPHVSILRESVSKSTCGGASTIGGQFQKIYSICSTHCVVIHRCAGRGESIGAQGIGGNTI